MQSRSVRRGTCVLRGALAAVLALGPLVAAAGDDASPGFRSARDRSIEIGKLLNSVRPGPERSRLVKEMHELERG